MCPFIGVQMLLYRQACADVFFERLQHGIDTGEFAQQTSLISASALVGVIAESLVGPLIWATADQPTQDSAALISDIQAFCLRAVGAKGAV